MCRPSLKVVFWTHIFVILFCNSKPYNFDCESKDCKLKCNEVDECSCPPPLSLKNIFQSKYCTVDPDSLQRPGCCTAEHFSSIWDQSPNYNEIEEFKLECDADGSCKNLTIECRHDKDFELHCSNKKAQACWGTFMFRSESSEKLMQVHLTKNYLNAITLSSQNSYPDERKIKIGHFGILNDDTRKQFIQVDEANLMTKALAITKSVRMVRFKPNSSDAVQQYGATNEAVVGFTVETTHYQSGTFQITAGSKCVVSWTSTSNISVACPNQMAETLVAQKQISLRQVENSCLTNKLTNKLSWEQNCTTNEAGSSWYYDASGKRLKLIRSGNDLCLARLYGIRDEVQLYRCDKDNVHFKFDYNADTGQFKHVEKGTCLTAQTDGSGSIKLQDCQPIKPDPTTHENMVMKHQAWYIGSAKSIVHLNAVATNGGELFSLPFSYLRTFDPTATPVTTPRHSRTTSNSSVCRATFDRNSASNGDNGSVQHPWVVTELGEKKVFFFALHSNIETCADSLAMNCVSLSPKEVKVWGTRIIKQGSESNVQVEVTVAGVEDHANGDGTKRAQVRCESNQGLNLTFFVDNKDVIFPAFEFDRVIGGSAERKSFMFAADTFRLIAGDGMSGPIFVPNATAVYLGSLLLPPGSLTIAESGRSLVFSVPNSGLCSSSSLSDCDLFIRVVNRLGQPYPSRSKRAHFVRKTCHKFSACKTIPIDYRAYPRETCQVVVEGRCIPCPLGARCPGGSAMWALPGFGSTMAPTTTEVSIVACAVPVSRCYGYLEKNSTELCGPGYGGLLCGGCLQSFYAPPVGPRVCLACPVVVDKLDIFFWPALTILGVLVGVFFSIAVLSYIVLKKHGGSLKGGMSRSQEFMVYVCISLALLSQASRVSLGSLPPYMDSLATTLAALQMDVSGRVSPDCIKGNPFFSRIVLFSLSCACVFFLTVTLSKRCRLKFCRPCLRPMDKLRHGVVFWLCISYTITANFAVKTCHCVSTTNGTLVLATNSLVVCHKGYHAVAYGMALLAGILHVVLFPVVSCIVIVYVRRKYVTEWYSTASNVFDERSMWKYFLSNSYLPYWFWIRQLELGIVLISTICNEVLAERNIVAYISMYVALVILCSILYLRTRPFIEEEKWKLPVRLFSFLCIISYALTNFASSNLAFTNPELSAQLVPGLSMVTMFLCCVLFIVLIVCYFRKLVGGAKQENRRISLIKDTELSFVTNPLASNHRREETDMPATETKHS